MSISPWIASDAMVLWGISSTLTSSVGLSQAFSLFIIFILLYPKYERYQAIKDRLIRRMGKINAQLNRGINLGSTDMHTHTHIQAQKVKGRHIRTNNEQVLQLLCAQLIKMKRREKCATLKRPDQFHSLPP